MPPKIVTALPRTDATKQDEREDRKRDYEAKRARLTANARKLSPELLGDLLTFAKSAPDGSRAAGRYDVVARLFEWQRP